MDTISTLNLSLTNSSSLTGTINIIENTQNGTAVQNNTVITLVSSRTWTLTGGSLTSLDSQGTKNYNGYSITLADETVLNG